MTPTNGTVSTNDRRQETPPTMLIGATRLSQKAVRPKKIRRQMLRILAERCARDVGDFAGNQRGRD